MQLARVTCVLALIVVACGPSRGGGDDTTGDAMAECIPEGAHRCQGASYQTCTGGTWQTAIDCPQACLDNLGCVQCHPGQTFCKDGNVWSCDDTGNPGSEVAQCTGVNTCVGGSCVDACADAAASRSYIGCEYWAVDLDNAVEVLGAAFMGTPCNVVYGAGQSKTLDVCYRTQGIMQLFAGLCDPPNNSCPSNFTCTSRPVCVLDAQTSPFAIVVSNPHTKDVTVTVTGPGNQTITRVVPAGGVDPILPQMGNAIPDQSVDGTIKAAKAYKIVSDLPIVAYQFNPLNNVDVFSNDASLLIPRAAFDMDYYALAWPTLDRRATAPGNHRYHGYLTVVAWENDTQITVTPKVAVQASATQSTIAAGTPTNFTLNAFEVLQLQASGAGDLTGSSIVSTNMKTFGVFGGHEAAFYAETTPPDNQHTQPCCADHLEEMIFPASTWGKSFAISRSKMRAADPDILRIMAQKPGTTVMFTPPPSAGTCGTLGAGEFCEVKIMGNTEVVASEPVLVGHYLQAATWYGNIDKIGTGDPSMAIQAPTEQYRKDYTFLVPSQYDENYVAISAAATGAVQVDGMNVMLTQFPGGGTYRSATVQLQPGQHKITCADGCGILVFGYSDDVSYMFAGGLDLKPIVIL